MGRLSRQNLLICRVNLTRWASSCSVSTFKRHCFSVWIFITIGTEAEFLSLKSFPSCYSQSPLASPWDFYFFKLTQTLTIVLYSVHRKGERRETWYKTIENLCCKKSIKKPQVWELSRLCQETSTKFYVHEFGFWTVSQLELTAYCIYWEYTVSVLINVVIYMIFC